MSVFALSPDPKKTTKKSNLRFFPLERASEKNPFAQGPKLNVAHREFTLLPTIITLDLGNDQSQQSLGQEDEDSVDGVPQSKRTKTFRSARTQFERNSPFTQASFVIGKFVLPNEKQIKHWLKILKENKHLFGCCIRPESFNREKYKPQTDGSYVYEWETSDRTPYGWPLDQDTFDYLNWNNTSCDWLTGLLLKSTYPIVGGAPGSRLHRPHAEHTLPMLEAVSLLAIYNGEYRDILMNYNSYILEKKKRLPWDKREPNIDEFNSFLLTLSKTPCSSSEWVLIKRLKMEYLYALPDSNLEKSDATLLRVNADGDKTEFNMPMAINLADRIWNRIIIQGGLLDTYDLTEFKEYYEIWKKNIIASWKQRMNAIANYINLSRGTEYGQLDSLQSVFRYIYGLHPLLRDRVFNSVRIIEPVPPANTVPSTPFKILIMQTVTGEVSKYVFEEYSFDNFDKICLIIFNFFKINKAVGDEIISKLSRKSPRFHANLIAQVDLLIFLCFMHYNSIDYTIEEYLRVKFATLYYSRCVKNGNYTPNDGLRQTVLDTLFENYKKLLLNIIHPGQFVSDDLVITHDDVDNFFRYSRYYMEERESTDKNMDIDFGNIYNCGEELHENIAATIAQSTLRVKTTDLERGALDGLISLKEDFGETVRGGSANKKKPQTRKRPKKRISRKYKRQNVHRYKNRNTFRKYANQ